MAGCVGQRHRWLDRPLARHLFGEPVLVHRWLQYRRPIAGHCDTSGQPGNDLGSGHPRLSDGADCWDIHARPRRLCETLSPAESAPVSARTAVGNLANVRAVAASLREHDVWASHRRLVGRTGGGHRADSPHGPRPVDWAVASIHLRRAGHCLYRGGDPCGREGMTPEACQMMVAMVSIAVAGLTTALGAIGAALGESRIGAAAMDALARQPDEAPAITRNLFVSLAMVESTAIFCLVVGLILLFANPYVTIVAR